MIQLNKFRDHKEGTIVLVILLISYHKVFTYSNNFALGKNAKISFFLCDVTVLKLLICESYNSSL